MTMGGRFRGRLVAQLIIDTSGYLAGTAAARPLHFRGITPLTRRFDAFRILPADV
jgi:hypothetical protein